MTASSYIAYDNICEVVLHYNLLHLYNRQSCGVHMVSKQQKMQEFNRSGIILLFFDHSKGGNSLWSGLSGTN